MAKEIKARIQLKKDTEAHWNQASQAETPFKPKGGEPLYYTDKNMIKVGDGEKTPDELEFLKADLSPAAEEAVGDMISPVKEDLETLIGDDSDTSARQIAEDVFDTKLAAAGIAAGAEVNVQSDWAQTDDTADDYIKNKPSLGELASKDKIEWNDISDAPIVPTLTSQLTNDSGFITVDEVPDFDPTEVLAQANTYTDQAVASKTQVQVCIWEADD